MIRKLAVLTLSLCCYATPTYAFKCAMTEDRASLPNAGSGTISKDAPPVDLLGGDECPGEPDKCTRIAKVAPGEAVGIVAYRSGFACVYYSEKDEAGNYVRDETGKYAHKIGWIQRDQLALECTTPKVTGEAEVELARVVKRHSGIELFSGDSCPRDESKCIGGDLVKAPPIVALGQRMNGHVCIQFGAGSDDHSGWVKSDRLRLFRPAPARPQDWPGHYTTEGSGTIDIAAIGNGRFKVAGAVQIGSGDGGNWVSAIYEQAGLAEARLNLETLTVAPVRVVVATSTRRKGEQKWDTKFETDPPHLGCALILRRVGIFLIVSEKAECLDSNGNGIGFAGIWTREKGQAPDPRENYVETMRD